MTQSLYLTEEELVETTGYKRPSLQARQLARNGIRFIRRADGHLRVARSQIDRPARETSGAPGVDLDAVRKLG